MELLDRRELEERVYDEYDSYFQYFIAIGLLLLLAEFFAPALRRKKTGENRTKAFCETYLIENPGKFKFRRFR